MKKGLPIHLLQLLKITKVIKTKRNSYYCLKIAKYAISRSEFLKNSRNIESIYHEINRTNLSLKPSGDCNQCDTLMRMLTVGEAVCGGGEGVCENSVLPVQFWWNLKLL